MSRTLRGRRVAFDNIAAGAATGVERTNADTVSLFEMPGGGFCTSTSTAETWHSNVKSADLVTDQAEITVVPENTVAAAVAQATAENVKAGG